MLFLVDLWRSVTGNKHKEIVKIIPMSYKSVIELFCNKKGSRCKEASKNICTNFSQKQIISKLCQILITKITKTDSIICTSQRSYDFINHVVKLWRPKLTSPQLVKCCRHTERFF